MHFHQQSFRLYLWDSDMSFTMESPVTTTFFLFLCFDGLFVSSFRIPVLLTFCIWVLLLVLLGSRSSFHVVEFEVSNFLLFFFKRKSIIAFFSIDSFSKVDTLLFKSSEKGEFLRLCLLKHQILRIVFQWIYRSFEKLYFLQESDLARYWPFSEVIYYRF